MAKPIIRSRKQNNTSAWADLAGIVLCLLFFVPAGSAALCDTPGSLVEINPPKSGRDRPLAIVGAMLVDVRGGAVVTNSVVIVRGERIISVGSRLSAPIPADTQIFDAAGLTLVPGLMDSHFHIERDYELPALYLSHGVTSVRDPGQWIEIYSSVRRSTAPQPRCFMAGPHLDSPPHAYPQDAFTVTSAAQARDAVNRFVDDGASHIKAYYRLPLDLIAATCAAAHQRGVPVTTHLELVNADEAILAGVDGIEHVTSFGTVLADKADADSFRETVRKDNEARRKARYELWSRLDLDHSPRLQSLIDLIVKQKTILSPTLAVFERRPGDKGTTDMEARGYVNMLKFVRLCHRAGATIVVGSHSSVPKAERGRAYQRELEILVECGLTPLEVLQAATFNNARFFHTDSRLGSIEPGKLADLVLVHGDPLADISAMRRVERVMLNGQWLGEPGAIAEAVGSRPKDTPGTTLSIKGTRFALNGNPTFLYGISYYGAIAAPAGFIQKDLDEMQANGFNWIRVWANWRAFGRDAAAIDEEGREVGRGMENLRQLVAECDRRGMVVDVSLSRGNGVTGPPRLQTLEAHKRAVGTLVKALKNYRNWYLDLSNERNIQDKRFTSFDDLKELRAFAGRLNASLLVTASHSPDIARDELREYVERVRVDFISPHRPRGASSAAQTAARTGEYFDSLQEIGRVVPVHFQEPFRRGFTHGWNPIARDFVQDALAARAAGAAGWCFHNGDERDVATGEPRRSFDLTGRRLFDQLDGEEKKAIADLKRAFGK